LAPRFKGNDASLYVFFRKNSDAVFCVPVDVADEPQTSSGGNRVMRDSDASAQPLQELATGPTDPSDLLGRELDAPIAGGPGETKLLNRKLNRAIECVFDGSKSGTGGETGLPDATLSPSAKASEPILREALERMPPLVAERTYKTSHPGYDGRVVRKSRVVS
jgi:hypothetical protein